MGVYKGLTAAHVKRVFCKAAFDACLSLSLLWICRTYRVVSANHNPAGGLCMGKFKAARDIGWELLKVFILLWGKHLEFLGTPYLSCLPWLLHSLNYSFVFGHEEGTDCLSCLGSVPGFSAGVGLLQGQRVQPQQDCHIIIFCAIPAWQMVSGTLATPVALSSICDPPWTSLKSLL